MIAERLRGSAASADSYKSMAPFRSPFACAASPSFCSAIEVEKMSLSARCASEATGMLARTKPAPRARSEEHTSELQSLMRNSYAVFCLKQKKGHNCLLHHHRKLRAFIS